MAKSNLKDPNYLLAPENIPGLNQRFYEASPHDYFYQRLQTLVLVGGRAEDLERLVQQGVSYGRIQVSGDPTEDPEKARDARERYLITEAETLFHHVSESLLRLFFAHAPKVQRDGSLTFPPCPWLELAKEWDFTEFKRRLDERFISGGGGRRQRMQVAAVFYGCAEPAQLRPSPPTEQWEAGLHNLTRFLAHYAHSFVDRSGLYNAVKHGLAVMPGQASVKWDDGAVINTSGPSIQYLERAERDGRMCWQKTVTWVDVDQTMAFIYRACQLIEGLWSVAKGRYLGAMELEVRLFDTPPYEAMMAGPPIRVTHMHEPLRYYQLPHQARRDQ